MPNYAPELIFNPQWNYSVEEIADLAGIPREVIERAGQVGEISAVYVIPRGGQGKAWKGDKIAAWIRRRQIPMNPNEIIRRTVVPESE